MSLIKLLLAMMLVYVGPTIYGMEKEVSFSQLPPELRRYIAALLLEKTVGYTYKIFRKIDIEDSVNSVACSPDGKTILTGSHDALVQLWNIKTGRLLKEFLGHTNEVTSVAFSPDGKTILTGSKDKTARVWNVDDCKMLKEFTRHTNALTSVAFSPDGNTVLTGSLDKTARLWDRETGEQLKQFPSRWISLLVHILTSYSSLAVAFSPDGKTILTRVDDEAACLWDRETGEELKILSGEGITDIEAVTGHADEVTSVAYSPDGKSVLTGSMDHTARLWDIQSGKQLKLFKGHTDEVTSVAFSPEGNSIITGSKDTTAILWDILSTHKLRVFKDHTAPITSVLFSNDGEMILTGSSDHTISIYRRYKESEEETAERFEKRKRTTLHEYREKIKFIINPISNNQAGISRERESHETTASSITIPILISEEAGLEKALSKGLLLYTEKELKKKDRLLKKNIQEKLNTSLKVAEKRE